MSKRKDNEEFKPNVIEPIEGQMRYDELLMPQKEEKVQEKDVSVTAGQMDFWSVGSKNTEQPQEKVKVMNEEVKKPVSEEKNERLEERLKHLFDLDFKKTESKPKTARKTTIKLAAEEIEKIEIKQEEFFGEEKETSSDDGSDNGGKGGNGGNGGFTSGVLFKPLEEVLHDSMIPYTESVVMDRALPRVEDGLKPVQRRILYSMLELGLTPDKPYRKSARIVGDCMGKYHPHGDSSVYDAMVRMSQDFSLRCPLVDGHGNFGSVDGDSAAAMRYTEARLTPLSLELLRDLEKDTVRWGLNFDDTLKEPEILPGRFPNLLVNGTSGIAVGVATNIPPHNLGEVIDGVVAYIDNPNISLDNMMKIIKGPDFPTGGELILGEGLKAAYETGKGKITIRAKVGVETNGDKQSIIITEIPYQVNKALLLQKIAELKEKNKDKLSVISEIRDESDRTGMRVVIRLKKEANVKKILGYLYQSTNLQTSFSFSMIAIAGGKPKQMGLLDIISYYTAYQRDVIVRRTKFDLNVAKERAHIIEGLLIAIKNIDAVIKIIKTSANVAEAKQRLRDKFALSEKQAQAILDMRLARLVNLEVNKLEEELKELKLKIKELEDILGSKKLQLEVVKKEILEIKKKYNTPRRSVEIKSDEIVLTKIEDMEDTKNYLIALSAGRTLKKVSTKNYAKSQKVLTENSTLFDIHTSVLEVKPSDTVLIFTDRGNCIKMQVDKIPECKWKDKGVSLKNLDKAADIMETPVSVLKVEGSGEIVMFTKQGMVKRTSEKDLVVAKSFYQTIKLSDDDVLLSVEHERAGRSLVMLSKNGYCVNFEKGEVTVQGRIAGGVKGINLEDKDFVVYAGQSVNGEYMIVTNNGFAKRLSALSIPLCARYRKGVKYINFEKGGKAVSFACDCDKIVADFGLKFGLLEKKSVKSTNDRLSAGDEAIKKRFLGIYPYFD